MWYGLVTMRNTLLLCLMAFAPLMSFAGGELPEYLALSAEAQMKRLTFADAQSLSEWARAISKHSGKNFILERDLKVRLALELPEQTEFKFVYRAFLASLQAQGLETCQTGKFIRIMRGASLRRAEPEERTFVARLYRVGKDQTSLLLKFWEEETRSAGAVGIVVEPGVVIIVDKQTHLDWLQTHFDGLQ